MSEVSRLYLGGIGGVGKSTLAQNFPKRYPGYTFLSAPDVMMHVCGVGSREELAALPADYKRKINDGLFLDEIRRHSHLVMDGHFIVTDAELAMFTHLFYVICSTEGVLEYRVKDQSRRRSISAEQVENEIKDHNRSLIDVLGRGPSTVYLLNNDRSITAACTRIHDVVTRGFQLATGSLNTHTNKIEVTGVEGSSEIDILTTPSYSEFFDV